MDQTIKNAPREKLASVVEQSLHIQEVIALKRVQSVLSVEKRNIMALFANTKAKEGVLMSYKPSLSMHPQTKTVQWKTIHQCMLLQPRII